MALTTYTTLHQALTRWSRYLLVFVIFNALSVLIGWAFAIEALRNPLPNTIAMNPVTAVLFLIAGASLMIKNISSRQSGLNKIANCLIIVVIIASAIDLADESFNLNIQIDDLLFSNKLRIPGTIHANRMTTNTAFSFILSGIAIIYIRRETITRRIPSQYFALVTALLSLLILITYIYRTQTTASLNTISIPLGTHAAFCFLFLSISILFAQPAKGMMKQITSSNSGSTTARILIPVAIIIPIVLGLLRLFAYNQGWISAELGTALLVFSIILVFLVFIWFTSRQINRRDTQREKIQGQLKQRAAQVQSIFRSAPDAIIVIDDNGIILNWNSMAEKMFGWKKKEALGKLLTDTIIPERYKANHIKGLKRFSQNGTDTVLNRTIEIAAVNKSGEEFSIALSIALTALPKRTVFIGFIRDITEQKKAEENIRYNSLLLENVSDAVISTDENLLIRTWNAAAEKMYGYSLDEVKGKNINFLGLILSSEILNDQNDSVKQQGFYRDEYVVRDKNGKDITILASFNVIEADNKITGYVAVHRDISIRKILEAQLRTFNKNLSKLVEEKTTEMKSVFDRVSDAFLAVDKDWRYIYANKQLGEMIRLDPQSLIGNNIWELFPDSVGSVTYETFHRAMVEQRYICSTDYYAPLDLWQENHIYPSPNGLSVFIRDVTERKKAEEKIMKANRIYFFISQVNQMIVHTTTEETLFKEACRIAVETGKFKMAWIGMLDEKTNSVVPVMYAGDSKGYKEIIERVSLDLVNNPVAAVIIDGRNQVTNDSAQPGFSLPANFKSSMSVPLTRGGKIVGVFSFYTGIEDFFDEEEITLLQEAASDVSFAMDVIDKERIKKLTEHALKNSEKELQQSYEAIRSLVSHLQDIREEERLKMAQEIHDELGQQLTIMKMDVSWLDQKLGSINPQFKEKTEALKLTLDGTVKTVRRIASELRPSVLDDMGLAVAIEWQSKEIENRSGIKIMLSSDNIPALNEHIKIGLFRVVQEALTNVVRYSKATKVDIDLGYSDNKILLSISDNGIGFDPTNIAGKKTLGILGMKERVASLNGNYLIDSSPGNGTVITVSVPTQT